MARGGVDFTMWTGVSGSQGHSADPQAHKAGAGQRQGLEAGWSGPILSLAWMN